MREYLVPRAVRTRMELFPGIGVPEILSLLCGGAVGAAAQGLFALLPLPLGARLAGRVALVTLPIAVAFAAGRDMGGGSAWHLGRVWWRWRQRPQRHLYRRGG